MDPNYMKLALKWPEDLREKLKQSHQLLKESYLEPSRKYVPYKTGIDVVNGNSHVKNMNRSNNNKITKPKSTKTSKKNKKINSSNNNDSSGASDVKSVPVIGTFTNMSDNGNVNKIGRNVPGTVDISFGNSMVTTKTKINPIFVSTEFTRTTQTENTGPMTYTQQRKEIKRLQKEISRLMRQRELDKMKQHQQQHQQQQYELTKCLDMNHQWKAYQKSYKAEVLGIKPVCIVENSDIPSDGDKRKQEIYKVYKLKKPVKSQPESVVFPKNAILEIKRNADLDFSKLIMVAIDPRARTTNTFYFGYLVGDPLSVYCQYFHNHVLCNSKITFKDENELKLKLARRCRNHLMSSHGVESIVNKEKLLETINPLKSDMLTQILLSRGKLPWDKEKAKKNGSSDDKAKNEEKDDKNDGKSIMKEVLAGTSKNSLSNVDIDNQDKIKNDKYVNSNSIVQMVSNYGNKLSEKNKKLTPNLNPNLNPITIIQERGYLQLSSGGNNHINNTPSNNSNSINNNNIMNTTDTITTDSNSNTHPSTNNFTNNQGAIDINGLMNGTTTDNTDHNNSSSNSGGGSSSSRSRDIPNGSTNTNTTINNTHIDKNLIYPSMSSPPYHANTLQQRDNDSGFPTIDERGYQINTLFKGT